MTKNLFKSSITPEEISQMPLGAFDGEIHVIDSAGLSLLKAIAYLRRQKVIGFDTETRPVFSPGQHSHGVALLQLSGPGKAYLFRVQSCGFGKMLASLLSNEKILKIGAATSDDVRGLRKLYDFTPAGFVDLQKIVSEWGIADKSVKKMAAITLGLRISKSQQLSNWEADKLSEAQMKYAATDAWVCREMYNKLKDTEKNPLQNDKNISQERQG